MSDFNINHITNKNGEQGPILAGITTVNSTGAVRIPSGATNYGRMLKEDPHYEYLSVGLPFNEPSGYTQFTDRSKYGDEWVTVNGVDSSTTQSKYYGTSAYWDGSGDRIYNANIGSYEIGDRFSGGEFGSWTWESWLYHTTENATGFFLVDNTCDQVSNGYFGRVIGINGEDGFIQLNFQRNNGADFTRIFDGTGTKGYPGTNGGYVPRENFNSDEWFHAAVTFDGPSGVWREFINGTLVGTVAYANQDDILETNGVDPADIDFFVNIPRRDFRSGRVYIGSNHSGAHDYQGYINDYRYYQGVCKYKKSFTAPTQMAF